MADLQSAECQVCIMRGERENPKTETSERCQRALPSQRGLLPTTRPRESVPAIGHGHGDRVHVTHDDGGGLTATKVSERR